MKFHISFLSLCVTACLSCGVYGQSVVPDVNKPAGVCTVQIPMQQPDTAGILGRFRLVLPAYKQGIYSAPDKTYDWQICGNRVLPWYFTPATLKGLFENPAYGVDDQKDQRFKTVSSAFKNRSRMISRYGVFMQVQLADGRYLSLLPLATPDVVSWLYVNADGVLCVETGTYGKDKMGGTLSVLAWGVGTNVNESSWNLFKTLREEPAFRQTFRMRYEKNYPEIFDYLGWCTWEEYKTNISAKLLIEQIGKLKKAPVPVRYVIIDAGHHSVRGSDNKQQLTSFDPNDKFPDGFAPILALRDENSVKWIGLWHNFNGYWGGFSPENDFGPKINACLRTIPESGYTNPKSDPLCVETVYDAFLGRSARDGFDFLKIDWQAANLYQLRYSENAARQAFLTSRTVDNIAGRYFGGAVINCMAMNNVVLLNTFNVNVTRTSIDYKFDNGFMAREHLIQAFHNALYMCPTVWGDHDMFHSSDKVCGRMMALSKALSGGPVYLSDAPEDIVPEMVFPLCYTDGRLLRPLAPAAPLQRSVFSSPLVDRQLYFVSAPLANGAAAIVAYNFTVDRVTAGATLTAEDYALTGTLIQPYAGPWKTPAEGLYVYDYYAAKGSPLDKGYPVSIKGFGDRYLLMLPVHNGWALAGRTDKYLAPAAISKVEYTPRSIAFTMEESGPVTFWMKEGTPSASSAAEVKIVPLGDGLWKALVPEGKKDYCITINRK